MGARHEVIELENIEEYEYYDYETFRTVLVMRAKYRGHSLGAKISVSDDALRDLRGRHAYKELLKEELQLQAERLNLETNDNLDRYYRGRYDTIVWWNDHQPMHQSFEGRTEPKDRCDWKREGF